MPTHQQIDQRSLAFAQAIATRLRDHPELVEVARQNLRRWRTTSSPRTAPALDEWEQALDAPFDQILALLTATSERATRLRQSNPFAGTLSAQERNDILLHFHKP
jgi:hypothetical protein